MTSCNGLQEVAAATANARRTGRAAWQYLSPCCEKLVEKFEGNCDMEELNDEGKIYRHTIEKLLINGVDAEPPYFGLFDVRQWLTMPGSLQPQGVVAPFPYHSDNPHAALDLN